MKKKKRGAVNDGVWWELQFIALRQEDMMQGNGQTGSLVKVFIRTRDKKARGVLLPRQISGNQLKKIAADKTHIPLESLTLFNQGHEIQQEAQLQDNNIIHAIDLRNVNVDNVHLYVKLLDQKAAREKYTVNTNTLIKDFISDNLLRLYEVNMDDIFLVYTGKQVDIHKNFKEELIENESEVVCVKVKNIQQKNKDQDKVKDKVSHEASHVSGQKKQEHDDKTIRIATKVTKIHSNSTTHALKSGKPDHQEQVKDHQEQTEVILSMKEVEQAEQRISENVVQLNEASIETENQEDGLHEILPENQVAEVTQHEESTDPVESRAVLHSSAPVAVQNACLQINFEQPRTTGLHAEADKNDEKQPTLALEFKEAYSEPSPVEKSPQEEARQQVIVETQAVREANGHLVLQEPNVATQIQENVVLEQAKQQEIVIQQDATAQNQAQTVITPDLHYFEQKEGQNVPEVQAEVGHSESPHVIAEQQIVERVDSKPVEEEQAITPSHEIIEQATLPVQAAHENLETVHNEVADKEEEPVEQKIHLQSGQQEQLQNTDKSVPSNPLRPGLTDPPVAILETTQVLVSNVQIQEENNADQANVEPTDQKTKRIHNPPQGQQLLPIRDQNVPDNADIQIAAPLRNQPSQQEQKTRHIQISQYANLSTLLINDYQSKQAQLKEQIQETTPLVQQQEPVVYNHEEPVKIEEKQSQNIITIEHEAAPNHSPNQEVTEKTQDIVHEQSIQIDYQTKTVLESGPIDRPIQAPHSPRQNLVQKVEIEQNDHQQSGEKLHKDKDLCPVEEAEPIKQETTDTQELTVAPHVEAPLEQEVRQAPTLQAVHHEEPVLVEVRQQVHERVTETVHFEVIQTLLIVEQQQVAAPIAVQSPAVLDSEPLVIHSQNKTEVVAEDLNSHKYVEQQLKINDLEVVSEKTGRVQHVDAPILNNQEAHEDKEKEAVKQPTIHAQNYDQSQEHQTDPLQSNPTVEQKYIAPVVETHQTEQIVPESAQHHNKPADHTQPEPIIQEDISVHKETEQAQGELTEAKVALQQQNIQEEPVVEAKIVECSPIQEVEYHSEGHVAAGPILNTQHIEQPEQRQHRHNSDNAHQAQAVTEQVQQAEHRQASELETNIDDELYDGHGERPATEIIVALEAQQPPLEVTADNLEINQHEKIEKTQPVIELALEESRNQPLDKINHLQAMPYQQLFAHPPAKLASTEQNPVQESAAVQNSEEQVFEDKALAETGHQWEVKDQSAPIVLEQFHQQHEGTTTRQNGLISDVKIEQQSHQIELERGVEEPVKQKEYVEEIVHQEPVVSFENDTEPKSAVIVSELQGHQPVLIETSPTIQNATIEVQQAAADHHVEITQRLQSHPNEHNQQQVPVKTQEPKEPEINHDAQIHHENTEVERPIHTAPEAVILHQQQRAQERTNQNETKEEAAPEVHQTHENIAEEQIQTPVELQAVAHQPVPDTKEVDVQEISHEMEPAINFQEAHAVPVKAEPETVTKAELVPQVHYDQYSQLPYVSSSQLPLSQDTSSSFGNISHNNLQIIAHLNVEAPFQSTQKGVAFESLTVKSPHSTTNECLIYQEQIIQKSGKKQISIVQAEEITEENTYNHAAPIPEEFAEPSLIENINHEEVLPAVTANEPTD